jgi:hypothetical protein
MPKTKKKPHQKPKKKGSTMSATKKKTVDEMTSEDIPVLGEDSPIVDAIPEAESISVEDSSAPRMGARGKRRTDATYVALEKLLEIVEEVGLTAEEKKAWLRINGPSGSRVYVPRRKHVGRVDIAGMEAPEGTSVKLGEKSFGAVKEQLDMDAPEEVVLRNFRSVLKHMASLPSDETGASA